MNVHQVSFLAFWAALQGFEQDLDLHLSFQLISCCPATPEAWLQGHKQAESTAYQPPHHDAAVHSWHNEGLAAGGGRGEALKPRQLLPRGDFTPCAWTVREGRYFRNNDLICGAHGAESIVCVK